MTVQNVSDRVFVATRKGMFTVERGKGPEDWSITKVDFLGDHASYMLPDARDGSLYVALYHGHFGVKLHRSRDRGRSWVEVPAPSYPPKPESEPAWEDMHGREVPHSLEMIWCLEAGHPSETDTLWCGTIPGGLFESADGGESWRLVQSLWDDPLRRRWFGGGMDYPGIHSVCIHPDEPRRVTIAVSCGGVWQSDDRGATWQCIGEGFRGEYLPPEQASDPAIQDIHRLAQCPADAKRFWVQHHNGIFRSENAGRTWTEIADVEPSVFGFATAVHPTDPDTAWFVPAVKDERRIPVDGKVIVARTRDGGRSFESLTHGLPQDHAYDICYRHALDVDGAGERLALGSTTGSLWISEDGGERWHDVTTHLPPIYAVRFEPQEKTT